MADETYAPPWRERDLTNPVDVLARTLYGEARGEGTHGMRAVACTIRNRANNPRWWGKDIVTVCLKPWQFSVWNQGDPNRAKILAATIRDRMFPEALEVARDTVAGRLPQLTNRSDHYHTKAVRPIWSRGKTPVATIGGHLFFRLEIR